MKSSAAVSRVKVSADGHGVVSHAGVGMLRELADLTGLSAQVTAAPLLRRSALTVGLRIMAGAIAAAYYGLAAA